MLQDLPSLYLFTLESQCFAISLCQWILLAHDTPMLYMEALYHPVLSKEVSSKIVIISAPMFLSCRKELESTGISYLLVRMSNDKVVGIGGDGQSSHREIVSRYCAVKLGRNNRHKRWFCVTFVWINHYHVIKQGIYSCTLDLKEINA